MPDETDDAILKAMAPGGSAYRTLPQLQQLTGLPADELALRLSRLERQGYLYGHIYRGRREYSLSHSGQPYADALGD